MPGVERLCRTFFGKDSAARADCFSVGAFLQSIVVDREEPQTILAVAKLILLFYVISAPRTDEKTQSLRVINVQPVAAGPAFQYLYLIIAIIDHLPESAFIANHASSIGCHSTTFRGPPQPTRLFMVFL